MRLLSFRTDDSTSFGALVESRIVDLGRHLPEFASLRALLEADALVRALDTAAEVSAEYRLDRVDLRAPIPDPARLICLFDDPDSEAVLADPGFLRGSGRALPVPAGSANPLAAGIAASIGVPRPDTDAPTIVGITLVLYLSPGALAMGPVLVTPEELDARAEVTLAVAAGDAEAELALPAPAAWTRQVARRQALKPGDLVALLSYLPEVTAQPERTVTVTHEIIGTLRNPIEQEASAEDSA